MQMKFTHIFKVKAVAAVFVALLAGITSCTGPLDMEFSPNLSNPQFERNEGVTLNEAPYFSRRVFVLFSFGFNDISSFLNGDIEELATGALPDYGFGEDVVLVLKHNTFKNTRNYSQRTSPVLIQLYKRNENIIRDTLKVYADTTVAARANIVNEVLTYAKTKFPAQSYGMLMSSHGSGWAPKGYCSSPPDKSADNGNIWINSLNAYQDDGLPLTKSIGAHYTNTSTTFEISIPDLADAIPIHLDYIIFDACLMGGIEVAYELKDKCDRICFSQAEIMADGMDYKNLLSSLFDYNEIDLLGVAESFYNQYKNKSGVNRSATISVVDCRKLEPLSQIVEKHSEAINILARSNAREQVQGYFRPATKRGFGIFYDLQDIIVKSGASENEIDELVTALNNCVLCKYATEKFFATYASHEFDIKTHSGLSMYLYDSDREILNEYYKTLKWEQKVRLIE